MLKSAGLRESVCRSFGAVLDLGKPHRHCLGERFRVPRKTGFLQTPRRNSRPRWRRWSAPQHFQRTARTCLAAVPTPGRLDHFSVLGVFAANTAASLFGVRVAVEVITSLVGVFHKRLLFLSLTVLPMHSIWTLQVLCLWGRRRLLCSIDLTTSARAKMHRSVDLIFPMCGHRSGSCMALPKTLSANCQ